VLLVYVAFVTETTRDRWPELKHADWADTQTTLHMWTQIVGKIRLVQSPFVNHYWNVALYVTSRGLTTSVMPYHDGRAFEIAFDFVSHELRIEASDGERAAFPLKPMTVADFYHRIMAELHGLDFEIHISTKPNEVAEAIPFELDTIHTSYDRSAVDRFWQILLQADRLMKEFRSDFTGKASPVHFFWGSFDLAETRFSGRRAPPHAGGIPNLPDTVTRESYSHEEHSVGFWPGGAGAEAAFYAYAYPEPPGFAQAAIAPETSFWNPQLKEFFLPYPAVRASADPDAGVLSFFKTTFEAAATLGKWDNAAMR
jgi:hypothetical protein